MVYFDIYTHAHSKTWRQGYVKIYPGVYFQKPNWLSNTREEGPWIAEAEDMAKEKNEVLRIGVERIKSMRLKLFTRLLREPTAGEIADAYKYGIQEEVRRTIFDLIDEYTSVGASDENGNPIPKLSDSTINIYTSVKKGIKAMMQKNGIRELYAEDIDTSTIYQYELYMSKSKTPAGKSYNSSTIIKYIEKLKAVITWSTRLGYIKKAGISDSYVGNTIVGKKSVVLQPDMWKITPQDLEKIETTAIVAKATTSEEKSFHYKDRYMGDLSRPRLIFLFQSWTGFAFADLEKYGKDLRPLIQMDLRGKRTLVYNRAKNGILGIIPIFKQLDALMEALNYNVEPRTSYDTWKRKVDALLLHYDIKPKVDMKSRTHLWRHLCGCRMLAMGMSMESVSRILAHTSIKETEKVYAKIDRTKVTTDWEEVEKQSNVFFQIKVAV